MPDTAQLVARVTTKGVTKASTELNTFSKSANNAEKGAANFGRSSGQAGIQLQQFIGQIQGGQNAMLALSQQSADLGFVLGAPLVGAIVGISASVAGLLLPSLFESADAAEQLEEAMESLDEVLDTTGEGVDVLSDKIVALAESSRVAARVEISKGIVDAAKAITAANEQIEESFEDAFGTFTGLSIRDTALGIRGIQDSGFELIDVLNNVGQAGVQGWFAQRDAILEMRDELNISTEDTADLANAMSSLIVDGTVSSAENLRDVLGGISLEYGTANSELTEFSSSIIKNINAIVDAGSASDTLKSALRDLTSALDESGEAADKSANNLAGYILKLEAQVGALGLAGEELIQYKANLTGAVGGEREHIIELLRKVEAHKMLILFQKDAAKAESEILQRRSDLNRQFRESEEQDEIDFLNRITKEEEESASKRLKNQDKVNAGREDSLSSTFSNLAVLSRTGNKDLFRIGQAASAAEAVVNIAQGVTEALSLGPILGPALAASIAVAGGVQLAAINNAGNFEHGGFVNYGTTSGDNTVANVNKGEAILNTRQQKNFMDAANGSGGQSGINVVINNNAPGVDVSTSQDDDGRLNVLIDKRMTLNVTQPNSTYNKAVNRTRSSPRLFT